MSVGVAGLFDGEARQFRGRRGGGAGGERGVGVAHAQRILLRKR